MLSEGLMQITAIVLLLCAPVAQVEDPKGQLIRPKPQPEILGLPDVTKLTRWGEKFIADEEAFLEKVKKFINTDVDPAVDRARLGWDLTWFWVGLVTMAVVWFISTQFYRRSRTMTLLLALMLVGDVGAQAHVTKEPIAKDGTQVQVDIPPVLHMRNTGGSDGSGLCVFTSINHSAYYQNCVLLQEFQKYMTQFPGGGWPQQVDRKIKELAKVRHEPPPLFVQVETNDLDVLKLACKTGRSPGVTYSFSPTGRYNGQRISHMVSLVAAGAGKGPDGRGWWCILDNNYPKSYEWMSEAQFLRTYTRGQQGWAVILLNPGPPPVPTN
jgi:hypothetical protein